jgi:hypothetical protein
LSLKLASAVLGLAWLAAPGRAAVMDNFDTGAQNWKNGSAGGPQWTASGGNPGGCLANISSGLSSGGGKQVMYNQVQWAFNYSAACAAQLQFYARTTYTAGSINLRLALQGPGGSFSSVTPASLANDGQWHLLTLGLTAADLQDLSSPPSGDVVAALAGVTMLRLLANDVPSFSGTQMAATVYFDGITYLTGPCATATITRTASPTRSATPTVSATPTISPTPSITASFSASPTFSLTPSVSPTPSISPTVGALDLAPGLGSQARLGPVPAKSGEALCLAGPMPGGQMVVYNTALQRVAVLPAGAGSPCWSHPGLSPGVYWVRHEPENGPSWLQKIVLLP